MAHEVLPNPVAALSERYQSVIHQSHRDLQDFSGLHPDFIADCVGAIAAKKVRLSAPLLGELFPYLAAEGLRLPDHSRRRLAAAWLAMYGYSCLADYEMDKKGFLDARTSTSATALLFWSAAEIGKYTVATRYADTFVENMCAAFAGQYEDILNRQDEHGDRSRTNVDKNRGMVAVLAGFSAAANEADDRILRATECVLAPFQILDDLHDLEEDLKENNITAFVAIAKCALRGSACDDERVLYSYLISDPRVPSLIENAVRKIDEAILLLNASRDHALISYLSLLRRQISSLTDMLRDFQSGCNNISEPDIYGAIREIHCNS
jgi:hypothetical protein